MKLFFLLLFSLSLLFTLNKQDAKIQNEDQLAIVRLACETLTDTEKIICLAENFKSTLNSTQIASLQLEYTLANAKKWSNLPAALSARIGLKLGSLSALQLDAAQQLIKAVSGAQGKEGYSEIYQLWKADDYLGANGGGTTYGAGNFYIGFFGVPSMNTKWELQVTGHHMTLSNTYDLGKLKGATPSFRASEPFEAFTIANETHQPLLEEYNALKVMLQSLDASTQSKAKLSGVFSDIVLGPNKDWVFPTVKDGVKCSALNTMQKNNVIEAIKTYVYDVDDVSSKAIMDKYIAEIDDTYIAFSGNTDLTAQRDYVRIDGPSVWIEYSTQRGIVLNPNHPHSIWRDRNFDYGGTGNSLLSVSNLDFDAEITIFPNPFSNIVNIQIDNSTIIIEKVHIYDQAGKVVFSNNLELSNSCDHSYKISLCELPKGNYLCTLEIKKNGLSSKVSKKMIKI